MDGFKCYKYYMAIKLHFTRDSFNVFKNRGVVKGTREAFNARNDRYMFERLARKFPVDKDIIQFFVANFAYGNESAVYSGEESDTFYMEWLKRKQSITKVFTDDLNTILMDAYKKKLKEEAIINFTSNEYPTILNLYLGKQIGIETVSILNDIDNMVTQWKDNDAVVLLWENELRRIEKVSGFIKYESSRLMPIYKSFREEIKEL